MISKLNSWWQKPTVLVILTSLIMSVFMPYLFKLVHLAIAWRVGLLFIVLNGFFAWWVGRLIKKNQLGWWLVFIFPILFAIMVFLRFAKYDYWFVPIYLVLSLLALAKD